MTPIELTDLLRSGESETVEFKRSTAEKVTGTRTLCAMANRAGGAVIYGVDNSGRVVGQVVGAETLTDLALESGLIEPALHPRIERLTVEGREVIVVRTARGEQRPYRYKNAAYVRTGSATTQLSYEEYNRLLTEQLHGAARWENTPAAGWSVERLDVAEVVRTVDESIRRGRAEDPGTREPRELLTGLGLLKDGELLRAAVVLFARTEGLLPDYPQCLLRLARFRGVDKTEFVDNQQVHGNIFQLLLRAERFLRENLPVSGRVVPNLFERQDDPLFPPTALREALANAFAHRDYAAGGGSVGVAVFDDRVEISSSGSLHFGLKADDLYRPHESRPWNPLMAHVLYRRGLIESWGRGTIKIAELVTLAGLPRPEFEDQGGAVVVRLRATRYTPPARVGLDLSDRQQLVLRVLGEGGALPLRSLRHYLASDVSERTLIDDLSFLRHAGLIERVGAGRGAKWTLVGRT